MDQWLFKRDGKRALFEDLVASVNPAIEGILKHLYIADHAFRFFYAAVVLYSTAVNADPRSIEGMLMVSQAAVYTIRNALNPQLSFIADPLVNRGTLTHWFKSSYLYDADKRSQELALTVVTKQLAEKETNSTSLMLGRDKQIEQMQRQIDSMQIQLQEKDREMANIYCKYVGLQEVNQIQLIQLTKIMDMAFKVERQITAQLAPRAAKQVDCRAIISAILGNAKVMEVLQLPRRSLTSTPSPSFSSSSSSYLSLSPPHHSSSSSSSSCYASCTQTLSHCVVLSNEANSSSNSSGFNVEAFASSCNS